MQDTPLAGFYDDLLSMTYSLYPELDVTDDELWPLLLNSRAVSAYDATLLLTRSLNNNSIDTAQLRGTMVSYYQYIQVCIYYISNE